MEDKNKKKHEEHNANQGEEIKKENCEHNNKEECKKEQSQKEKSYTEKNKDRAEIEELKKQVEDYKDRWMRSVAEFDNYKRRNAKLWQDAFNEGISSVVIKILPVGDNLDRALSLVSDEKTQEGLKAIRRKYYETLKGMDIEEIDPVGEKFDPNIAEAVMQVDGEEGEQSETVKQVFEKGYKLKDKIIRYAKVSVVK